MPPHSVRKVLMTADSVGGVWTYALQLASELGNRGVEVTLVVMGGKPTPDQAREAGAIRNLSLIGTDFRLEWMSDPDSDLVLAGEVLLQFEAEQRPDIVHLNGFYHATLPFKAPILVVAHSCVSSWWRACRRTPLPLEWSAYGERVAAGVAAADLVVAPTAAYLDEFVALHGNHHAAMTIPNGRDPARFSASPKRQVALAAGRLWDDAKNISTLCRAAEGLARPIMIAGEATGPDGRAVETCSNVLWLGRLGFEDLAARMAEAAVFVSPARYEPFGLAILEAALSNCALILGDIPTLRELWDGAAIFVDPEDDKALREALDLVLDDPDLAAALGARACERAGRFTSERMANGYLAAYTRLLAESSTERGSVGVPA